MASTPTGIYNPADYISQLNTNGRTRNANGGICDRLMLNIKKLQPDTQAYLNELLKNEAMSARAEGRALNKYDMKKIEHMLRAKYGNVDPKLKFFDISGWFMTNKRMAKELNNYINSIASQPTNDQQPPSKEPEQKPDKTPETTQTQAETKENPNQKYIDAYHRLKQKKGTDEDLALFADWSEDKLKKFGFGPVTIKAIRDYANKPEETRPQPGEMSDRHRQELELQKQERAKNAEQSATDYLGTSSMTGEYTPTAEEQALLDEAAELRKKVGSRNTAERTAAQKRLTEIQPQLNEIARKKKEAKGPDQTAQIVRQGQEQAKQAMSNKNVRTAGQSQGNTTKDKKKTDNQPGDKPVSELSRAYAEADGER